VSPSKDYKNSHAPFPLIDNKDIYHIGASLKDLEKKMFAFSKMNESASFFLKLLDGE